jgi:hypothetical protein
MVKSAIKFASIQDVVMDARIRRIWASMVASMTNDYAPLAVTICPPGIGWGAPVVDGKVIGNPRCVRTAK